MKSIYNTETMRNRMIAGLGSLIESILSGKQENNFSIQVIKQHFDNGLNDSTIKIMLKDMISRNYLFQKGMTRYTYYTLNQSVLNRAASSSYTNAAIYYIDQLHAGVIQHNQDAQQLSKIRTLEIALERTNSELRSVVKQLEVKTNELEAIKEAFSIIQKVLS